MAAEIACTGLSGAVKQALMKKERQILVKNAAVSNLIIPITPSKKFYAATRKNKLFKRTTSQLNVRSIGYFNVDKPVHVATGKGIWSVLERKTKYGNNFHSNFQLRCNAPVQQESTSPYPECVSDSNIKGLNHCCQKTKKILLKTFVNKWNSMSEIKWKNDYNTRRKFIFGLGRGYYSSLGEHDQWMLRTFPMTEWNLNDLCESLKCLNVQEPYHIFEKIKELEKELECCKVTNEVFVDFYKRLSILLLEINIPLEDVDNCKPVLMKPVSVSTEAQELDPEIKKMKDFGDTALERGIPEGAIKIYSKAIFTCALLGSSKFSNHELSQLYSKRSAAYRELDNISSAEKDTDLAKYFSNLEFNVYEGNEEILWKFVGSERDPWADLQELVKYSRIASRDALVQAFINEWNSGNRKKWGDTVVHRRKFFLGPGKEFYESLDPKNQFALCRKKLAEWDRNFLRKSLKCLDAEVPYHIFDKIEELEKEMELASCDPCQITDEMYVDLFKRLCILLFEIGVPLKDIPGFGVDSKRTNITWNSFPISENTFWFYSEHTVSDIHKYKPVSVKGQELDPEIKKIKDLGGAAFEMGMHEEAISFYSKAIFTCAVLGCSKVPNDDLSHLYSKRSDAYRQLKEISSAEKNSELAKFFLSL